MRKIKKTSQRDTSYGGFCKFRTWITGRACLWSRCIILYEYNVCRLTHRWLRTRSLRFWHGFRDRSRVGSIATGVVTCGRVTLCICIYLSYAPDNVFEFPLCALSKNAISIPMNATTIPTLWKMFAIVSVHQWKRENLTLLSDESAPGATFDTRIP